MELDSGEMSTALSVSAAMNLAKGALENVTVKIVGEVSELSINPRYKAIYFTVKDSDASLPCMMWNNRYNASGIQLSIGAKVEISGRFTLYAAKGRMNFDVFSVSVAGEGTLRLQVARLAEKLKAEGLFDRANKKPLPPLPERIGLITSSSGAAVHDVLRTLRRRLPMAKVVFAGVTVEGRGAAEQMSEALRKMDAQSTDVILLVRGGGSYEDLMPFNDEMLVRTIAAMRTPIVTGIGHEPDTSIADMAADMRASTPTAAAESVSMGMDSLANELSSMANRMYYAQTAAIGRRRQQILLYSQKPYFQNPMNIVEAQLRGLDDMSSRIDSAISGTIDRFKTKVALSAASLDALSPLAVVARGYSITTDDEGRVIFSVKNVQAGEHVNVRVSDGLLECTLDSVSPDSVISE